MLSILCMPLYIMGIIMLAFPTTRPWVGIFGIMGVLGSAQAAFAVIPSRLDLLWLVVIHLVPAVLFLVVSIRAFRNRPNRWSSQFKLPEALHHVEGGFMPRPSMHVHAPLSQPALFEVATSRGPAEGTRRGL